MQSNEDLQISLTETLLRLKIEEKHESIQNVPEEIEEKDIEHYDLESMQNLLDQLDGYKLLDLAIILRIKKMYAYLQILANKKMDVDVSLHIPADQMLQLLNQLLKKINSCISSLIETKDESYKDQMVAHLTVIANLNDMQSVTAMIEILKTIICGLESINSGNIAKSIQLWKESMIRTSICPIRWWRSCDTKVCIFLGKKYGLNIRYHLNDRDKYDLQRNLWGTFGYLEQVEPQVNKAFSDPNAAYLLIQTITENITRTSNLALYAQNNPDIIFPEDVYVKPDKYNDVQDAVINLFIKHGYLKNNSNNALSLQDVKHYIEQAKSRIEQAKLEREKQERREEQERERREEQERAKQERIETERREREKQARERQEREKQARERQERERYLRFSTADGIFSAYNDNRHDFQEGVEIKWNLYYTQQEQAQIINHNQAISNLVQVLDYFANKNSNRKISTAQQEMLKNNSSFMEIIDYLCSLLPEFMQVSKIGEWAKRYEYSKSIESLAVPARAA